MRSCLFMVVLFLTFPSPEYSQVQLKRGDRPVFYSAGELVKDCKNALSIANGEPLQPDSTYTATPDQIAGAAKCQAYIDGMYDERLESVHGQRYHPVPANLTYRQTLVDAFIKYVADHPADEDLAAATVLVKAERTIINAQKPAEKASPKPNPKH